MTLIDQIDKERIPAHIAIIMDGNGRWAQAKGQPRTAGHAQGVEVVKNIAADAARIGVKFLTLYAFSTENWNRPTAEIEALMKLILDYLEEETFMKNDIRFRVIGGVELLPPAVQKRLNDCIEHTAANDRMTLTIALSYSSRWELTTTMQKMASDVKNGVLQPEDIRSLSSTVFCFDGELDILALAVDLQHGAVAGVSCGSVPIPNSTSATPTGQTSMPNVCTRPSWTSSTASDASARRATR